MDRHVSYEEYLVAIGLALARRHRPVWSRERRKMACRCGSELPCRVVQRVLRRKDWPARRELSRTLAEHTPDGQGFCAKCRMRHGPVRCPCQPVRLAVRTFAAELGERILDGLR